jgi:hypothetical protein
MPVGVFPKVRYDTVGEEAGGSGGGAGGREFHILVAFLCSIKATTHSTHLLMTAQ